MSLLALHDLTVTLQTPSGILYAVNKVALQLEPGRTVALVGESGSGKSMTARAIMGLLPPGGTIESGSIMLEGRELTTLPETERRPLLGNRIAMIFQEPMTSLNPVLRIGDQVMEPLLLHRRLDKQQARLQAIDLLRQVGVASPEQRISDYPHQLSGGQRQRVMIAMALACDPEILIAEAPPTALDVTIQAQILELIDQLRRDKGLALLLITHDLGIVAQRADQVHVMYAGRIVESGPAQALLTRPLHPYTKGLLASLPENSLPGQPLVTIPGHPPRLTGLPTGCPFSDRCPDAKSICEEQMPADYRLSPGRTVSCWNYLL